MNKKLYPLLAAALLVAGGSEIRVSAQEIGDEEKVVQAVAATMVADTVTQTEQNVLQPAQTPGETVAQTAKKSKRPKFDRGVVVQTFMPKGMLFFGGNISYTQHNNDDFKMLGLLKDFSSRGYTFAVRPMVGYSFSNNLAAGLAFTYERTMLQIDNVDLALGDLSFGLSDYYNIEHLYTGTIFLRNYINLGNSRRFALINDLKLQLGGGQGKMLNGSGDDLTGTYTKIYKIGVVCSPGVAVFVNDFAAVEATIGVLGYQYKRTEQTTDQIHHGSRTTSGANFKIDIFSIALGMTFYL